MESQSYNLFVDFITNLVLFLVCALIFLKMANSIVVEPYKKWLQAYDLHKKSQAKKEAEKK